MASSVLKGSVGSVERPYNRFTGDVRMPGAVVRLSSRHAGRLVDHKAIPNLLSPHPIIRYNSILGIIRRTKFKPWHIASPRHREAIVSAAAGVGVSSGSFHGR